MPDGVTVSVKKDALIRKFQRLVPTARVEVTAAALKGAEDVADLAKRFARSDRVKASIKAEPIPDRLAAMVVAGGPGTLVERRKGSGVFVSIARLEEFGTPPHENKGLYQGTENPGTKPHPFLFPAARLLKKKNKARISRAMGQAARKVAGNP